MDADLRTLERGSAEWWAAARRAGLTRMVATECRRSPCPSQGSPFPPCPECKGTGRFERCGVELAAYLGDPGAQEFLGIEDRRCRECFDTGRVTHRSPKGSTWSECKACSLTAWARGLEKWGPVVVRRAEHAVWCCLSYRQAQEYEAGMLTGLQSMAVAAAAWLAGGEESVREEVRAWLVPWCMGVVE